jgi:MerR family transcriptional regulator, light-induced transcriptional regulator
VPNTLLSQGHRPGEILLLSLRELDTLLALAESEGARPAAAPGGAAPDSDALERSLAVMLRAAKDLDREPLIRELRANWVRLGPLNFLQELAGTFMIEIGRAWQEKRLEVHHEHFASACLSDFLREVREPYDHEASGPRVAAALLPGDAHEGGLLMACALLAFRGYRILYLGADTPVEQTAAAATTVNAEAVTISVSTATPRVRAGRAVAELRRALPRRVSLWVGGAGAPERPKGVERFKSLAAFDARLSGLSPPSRAD